MKTQTPRQWLLDRHESSFAELDAIRREVLSDVATVPERSGRRSPGDFRPMVAVWIGAGVIAAALAGFIYLRQVSHDVPGLNFTPTDMAAVPAAGSAREVSQTAVPAPPVPAEPASATKEVVKAPGNGSAGPMIGPVGMRNLSGPATAMPLPLYPLNPGRGPVFEKDGGRPADLSKQLRAELESIKLRAELDALKQRMTVGDAAVTRAVESAGTGSPPIAVIGQVGKPGAVTLPPDKRLPADTVPSITLAEAINAAGGLTQVANGAAITVTRTLADGTKQVLGPFNLGADQGKSFKLEPGDIANVPMRLF